MGTDKNLGGVDISWAEKWEYKVINIKTANENVICMKVLGH